jgi:hypothetical protein
MLRIGTVVLNVRDARRASHFWSQALGYAYRDGGYNQDTTRLDWAYLEGARFVVLAGPEGNTFCVVNAGSG